MWPPLARLLSKYKPMNQALGEIIFETEAITGSTSFSFLQWRLKRGYPDGDVFVSLKLKPDAYEGPEGAVRNYLNVDLDQAIAIRDALNRCIDEYSRLLDRPSNERMVEK